jgi:predicted RNA binding protein YcfA (HicA-like mRNA interferase family)
LAGLPVVSGAEAVRRFGHAGWFVLRTRGSQVILAHPAIRWRLSVPQHRELDRGLLRALIRASGLTTQESVNLGA